MGSGLRTSVKMEGLDGLRIALRELPDRIQSKVLQDAVAKGAVVVRNEARAVALVDTGLLRRSIRSTRGKRRDSEASAFVSVRRLSKKRIAAFKQKQMKAGKKANSGLNPDDPYYWSILEFGKSTRTAHPFLRPAFNRRKEEAAKTIGDAIGKGVQVQAAKLYRETRGK